MWEICGFWIDVVQDADLVENRKDKTGVLNGFNEDEDQSEWVQVLLLGLNKSLNVWKKISNRMGLRYEHVFVFFLLVYTLLYKLE